jgi:hypothetical protein
MEPSSEIFKPWRMYSHAAWAALTGFVLSLGCGLFAPFALIPAVLLAFTSAALFWLAARPRVLISATCFNIGARSIAWQEICSIHQVCSSPLILRLQLTNRRRKLLIYPGEPQNNGQLALQLRERAFHATFNGVPFRDYQLWSRLSEKEADELGLQEPVKMVSSEEELEIERLYQTLKLSGQLDPASKDQSAGSGRSATSGKD